MPKLTHNTEEIRDKKTAENQFHHTSLHDIQSRKILKWVAFTRPKLVFGFEKLPSSILPSMSPRSRGISICFEKLQGWNLPNQLLNDISDGKCGASIQLSLSLFHLPSSTFFGSTWMSSPIIIALVGERNIQVPEVFDFSEVIYVISRLKDASCIGILEIVVSKVDADKNLATAQFGYTFIL